LNDFNLPQGKNLMPFSLKKMPSWFFQHVFHQIKINIKTKKRLSSTSKFRGEINMYKMKMTTLFFKVNKKNECIKLFAPQPHPRAGIGHQMATVLAGLELANKYKLTFAFSGLTYDWEQEMGLFPSSKLNQLKLVKKIEIDRISYESPNRYTDFVEKILLKNYQKKILFIGPFNDSKKDLTLGGEILRARYMTSNSQERPGSEKLVVHIRRGRIGGGDQQSELRSLRTKDYFEKIIQILEVSDYKNKIKEIVLLGTDLKELNNLNLSLKKYTDLKIISTMGCCDRGAFRLLATSKIMIGSKSGFSYVAGLVNPGEIYFPRNFWHVTPKNWKLF